MLSISKCLALCAISKLEDKIEIMILIGYHPTGAYKLYNPVTQKVHISRDVIVNETEKWKWESEPEYSSEFKQSYIYPDSSDESEGEEDHDVIENDLEEVIAPTRPQRNRQTPARLNDCEVISDNAVNEEGDLTHFALLADSKPINFKEAIKIDVWKRAMIEEIQLIEKNQTWELVNFPDKKKKIDVKWAFKLKLNPNGQVSRHKARLVGRGFLQKQGIDYNEVFVVVARIETVRLVIDIACKNQWSLYHLDVKSAFRNGPLEELVFVSQPLGFEIAGKQNLVYKLHKALYGLKQAPNVWNKKIDQVLIQIGFKKCLVEFGVYVQKLSDEGTIIICLYVDDLLITCSSTLKIKKVKEKLKLEFEMTDLCELSFFLGTKFVKLRAGMVMHQQKYIGELSEKFEMNDCNSVFNPSETVGVSPRVQYFMLNLSYVS